MMYRSKTRGRKVKDKKRNPVAKDIVKYDSIYIVFLLQIIIFITMNVELNIR